MNLLFLQKNYLFVLIAVIFSLVATFLMNIFTSDIKEKKTYVKSFIIAFVVSFASVYIHNLNTVVEEIISSAPPF